MNEILFIIFMECVSYAEKMTSTELWSEGYE